VRAHSGLIFIRRAISRPALRCARRRVASEGRPILTHRSRDSIRCRISNFSSMLVERKDSASHLEGFRHSSPRVPGESRRRGDVPVVDPFVLLHRTSLVRRDHLIRHSITFGLLPGSGRYSVLQNRNGKSPLSDQSAPDFLSVIVVAFKWRWRACLFIFSSHARCLGLRVLIIRDAAVLRGMNPLQSWRGKTLQRRVGVCNFAPRLPKTQLEKRSAARSKSARSVHRASRSRMRSTPMYSFCTFREGLLAMRAAHLAHIHRAALRNAEIADGIVHHDGAGGR